MAVAVDYLVVGSGLTGGTIARLLADAGREVLVLERRAHLGGNVHDHEHPSGIRVHTYGPHYFRTSSERVWEFVRRFADFHPYEAVVKSAVGGGYENWPVAASYIRRRAGPGWVPEFTGTPANFEEAALALLPRVVYEEMVRGYTEKQWGVPATALAAALCARFDVRGDDDPRLTPQARYQGIPLGGYARLTAELLRGVPVQTGCDYLARRGEFRARKCLVFTGPIDEYYGFDLGRLAYRGQRRTHIYHPDAAWLLPCGQVNNPAHAGGPHVRTLEWKHLLPAGEAARLRGTVLTTETPFTPTNSDHYEYPFPDVANARLYAAYRMRAEAEAGLLACGRLGEYRYLDMDQAIARALVLGGRLLGDDAELSADAGSASV